MGKTNVEIKNKCNGTWFLVMSRDGQVIKFWSFTKLIHALETASLLQLHVDNVNELPLSQYLNLKVS